MRGRVMSLWSVAFLGSTPIGGPLVGFVGRLAGRPVRTRIGWAGSPPAAGFGFLARRRRRSGTRPLPSVAAGTGHRRRGGGSSAAAALVPTSGTTALAASRVASPPCCLLVRHGRTAQNAARRLLGRMDVPLDELGRPAGRGLGRVALLRQAARVVTSPLRPGSRHRRGPRAAGHRRRAVGRDRLRRSTTAWRSTTAPELVVASGAATSTSSPRGASRWHQSAPGSERRARTCGPRPPKRDVVVVTHVSPIKAAVAWALGVGDETSWRMFVDVASVTTIGPGRAGAGPSTRPCARFNETQHRPSQLAAPPTRRRIVAAMAQHASPAIPQSRHLVTEIPGPKSLALAARRAGAVAPGGELRAARVHRTRRGRRSWSTSTATR